MRRDLGASGPKVAAVHQGGSMQISVKRSGGYAGDTQDLGSLDTAQQRSAAAQEAEQLVRSIGFFNLAPDAAIGADLFRYEITVRDDDRQHTVEFADDGSPQNEPLLRLVGLVQAAV
jgi:hypothetical protein